MTRPNASLFRRRAGALLVPAAVALLVPLTGCAEMLGMESKQLTRTEAALTARIDSLQARVDSLQNELSRAARRTQADIALLQRTVQEGNDVIAARLEENAHALSRAASAPAPAAAKPAGKASPKSASAGVSSAPAAPAAAPASETASLYNAARADFNARRWPEAYQGFKTVYETDPEGERAEDALYWMGLCFEKTNRPDNAVVVYKQLLEVFPQGKKSCSARFQMARLAESAGKAEERAELLRQLVSEPACSGTNEGRRAAEMLK